MLKCFRVLLFWAVSSAAVFGPLLAADSALAAVKKWEFSIDGEIRSSPAIGADGTVYIGQTGSVWNDERPGKMLALAPDGTMVWDFLTGHRGSISSATIGGDGTIYFGTGDGQLYAVNPDGTERWQFTVGSSVGTPAMGAEEVLYFGSGDKHLYAVTSEGTLLWKFRTGDRIAAAPVVGQDACIYVGSRDGNFYAVYPNGSLKWSFAAGGAIDASAAIGADGTLYFSTERGILYAVSPSGEKQWEYAISRQITAAPVIGEDHRIYIGSYFGWDNGSLPGNLYALNPDGTLAWVVGSSGEMETGILGSAVLSRDGLVIFGVAPLLAGQNYGRLRAVALDGTLKWEFDTEQSVVQCSPTIGPDGTIYVGTVVGKVFALSGSAGLAEGPWPKFQRDLRLSGNLSAPPALPPATPPQPVATVGSIVGMIDLSWPEDLSGSTYEVWRSDSPGFAQAELIAANIIGTNSFRDLSLPPDAERWYWIRARNTAGASDLAGPAYGRTAAPFMKWIFTAPGRLTTTPAVSSDGNVYIGMSAVTNGMERPQIVALSIEGTRKWEFDLESLLAAPPVVRDDGVIMLLTSQSLTALQPDGNLLWQQKPTGGRGIQFMHSPALTRDGVIVVAESSNLVAFASTGERKWMAQGGSRISASPVIASNGRIQFVTEAGILYTLDADGTQLWTAPVPAGMSHNHLALSSENILYGVFGQRYLQAINPDGTVHWNRTDLLPEKWPCVVRDDLVVVSDVGGKLIALSPGGAPLWDFSAYGPGATAGNTLYVYTRPALLALDLEGTQKWHLPLNGPTRGVVAAPVIAADGTIYFTHENRLYALAAHEPPAAGGWPMHRGDAQNTGRASEAAPPPTFLSITLTDGGEVRTTIASKPGMAIAIEVSSDLRTWSEKTNIVSDSLEATFTEPIDSERKFYRIRTE